MFLPPPFSRGLRGEIGSVDTVLLSQREQGQAQGAAGGRFLQRSNRSCGLDCALISGKWGSICDFASHEAVEEQRGSQFAVDNKRFLTPSTALTTGPAMKEGVLLNRDALG